MYNNVLLIVQSLQINIQYIIANYKLKCMWHIVEIAINLETGAIYQRLIATADLPLSKKPIPGRLKATVTKQLMRHNATALINCCVTNTKKGKSKSQQQVYNKSFGLFTHGSSVN